MRSSPKPLSSLAGLIGLVVLSSSTVASAQAAQPELALNRFEPSFAGDRLFGVQSPYAAGHEQLHLAAFVDYAHKPLVLRRESSGDELGAVVGSQLFVHINGTYALWEKLSINLNVPAALYQNGDSPSVGSQSFRSPSSPQMGDLRLGLRYTFLGGYKDPVQLAAGVYGWAPTGATNSYVSDNSFRARPQVIAGGRFLDRFTWDANLGVQLRPSNDFAGTSTGSEMQWAAGVATTVDSDRLLQIGAEYAGGLVLADIGSRTLNGELLASAKRRVLQDYEVGLAAGPGLSHGVGTPAFRGVLLFAYSPQWDRPSDRDGDGIVDSADACPDKPGPANPDPAMNGCPLPSDRDNDGIIDEADACPDVPGVASEDASKNGCPPDRDNDGIIDALDACPDVPGVATTDALTNGCPSDKDGDGIVDSEDACPEIKGVADPDPAKNGCPPDTDGDGFRDDIDACPREKGPDNADPSKRGCPTSVRVTDTEITILQQVQFDTAKATIKPASDGLLDEVASVLRDHPEILKVEVQGHTDNKGSAAFNRQLSQARARAVLAALISRGVDAGRLSAQGYGPDKPIADNGTEAGRASNRRVQFVITEKAEKKP